ncbi:hypothetical protein Tco_1019558 [Tanacetum coccineum]|uniref:Reverse transcriptase domain-containing protein n=1 Tax=Tanacetum coccineum TaxID=301880 RepID=A0ABQ5FYZ3_9ASTR
MRTRSQARKRRQQQVRQTSVDSTNLEKPDNPPIVTMADNRTMAQLLEAPTEGYEDAIFFSEHVPSWILGASPNLIHFDIKALNVNDQDSLNSAQVVNFWDKRPLIAQAIHRAVSPEFVTHDAKAIVAKVSKYGSASTLGDISRGCGDELKDMVRAL